MDGPSYTFDRANSTPGGHAGEADHLAASVLRSLSRSFRNQFSISAGQALFVGLVTFGLWPLWRLRRQFRDYLIVEKQQLWHASEWVRTRRGSDAAAALNDFSKHWRSRERWVLSALAGACVAAVIAAVLISMDGHVSLAALMRRTYEMPGRSRSPSLVLGFATWNVGFCLAYALHWLRVRLHVNDLRRYVEQFNLVAAHEGVAPVAPPKAELGLRTGWVLVAVLFWFLGAFWGAPLAVAAAAQRRYINGVAAPVRAQLLERLRQMVEQRRPPVAVPSYVIHDRRCANLQCRATLRASSRFCHRCGARSEVLGEVA